MDRRGAGAGQLHAVTAEGWAETVIPAKAGISAGEKRPRQWSAAFATAPFTP
jgi:hypothetical protein